ncbi:MAG: carbohydrate ABC transporter permease [Deltaproteobacteria bacterium]|nr:carbohydrate ABC transporter permease [Deltaproteobacteria bacterium]MBW1962156.1 carbohydrate ABC transporter permease [Deltaproteobacteria bacterium]MBW2154174.1 carbohydrate ABC transporter permease [Deltaproteobacteria bacterium]
MTTARGKHLKFRFKPARIFLYLALFAYVFVALFPFFWMVKTSMTPTREIYNPKYLLVPKKAVLTHYIELLKKTLFLTYFRNSAFVSLFSTLITLVISILAAYSLTRFRYCGRVTIGRGILFIYLVPQVVLFIPLYIFITDLKLNNSLWSLILVYPTFTVPFCTWMLMGYFQSLPVDLEEAALVDGCGRMQALLRIVLPLAAPGIVTSGIFSFNLAWNNYLYALVFITRESRYTLPIGISQMIFGDVFLWGRIMAASVLTIIPAILFFSFIQKFIVQGLTAGAIK